MKTTIFTISFTLALALTQANSLLTAPQIGQPFTTGTISDIELVSNGIDVALIIANSSTGKLYAIDINDNNPADTTTNAITQIPNFKAEVEAHLGFTVTIQNFEVNPISKSVYVLVYNASGTRYIVVVKNSGADFTTLDLTNVHYATINFTNSDFLIQDMSWGNNKLYISSASGWTLEGEIGTITAPFAHNSSTINRSTSMFKSNWGGSYWTEAPLEKLDFATINSKDRLVGVTVCAPGFSIETSFISGTGILQVQEQFNVNASPPLKVVAAKQNDITYLFDLHLSSGGNVLIRIGEKYIDGSRILANEYNNNRKMLRDNSGNPASGLIDSDVKIYNGENFKMIAYYTDYELLVLDDNDILRLFKTGSPLQQPTDIKSGSNIAKNITVYPNPTQEWISIHYPDNLPEKSKVIIYTLDGKEVYNETLLAKDQQISITSLKSGIYLICVLSNNQKMFQDRLVVN